MKRREFLGASAAGLLSLLYSPDSLSSQRIPKTLVLDPYRDCYRQTATSSKTYGRAGGMSYLYGLMKTYGFPITFSFVGEGCIGDITYDKLRGFDLIAIETEEERIYADYEVDAVKNFLRNGGTILLLNDNVRTFPDGYREGQFMHEFGFVQKPYDGNYVAADSPSVELHLIKPTGGTMLKVQSNTSEFTRGVTQVDCLSPPPAKILNSSIAEPILIPAEPFKVIMDSHYIGRRNIMDDIPSLDFQPQLPAIHFSLGSGEGIFVAGSLQDSQLYRNIANWIRRRATSR